MTHQKSTWSKEMQAASSGTAADVLALACPKCGQHLSIRFDPESPQPDGSTAGCLMITCWGCTSGCCVDRLLETPPWTESLGLKIETQPNSTRSDSAVSE